MFADIILLVIDTATLFLTLMFLLRFFMQWQRIPFRNQLGQFVVTTTDWAVRPLRRLIPGLFGFDLASLLLAWFMQIVLVVVRLMLSGLSVEFSMLPLALGFGLIELCKAAVWMVFGVVMLSAVLSWINPLTPVAPVLNALASPFLRPFRRVIPPVANIDLSPLALLLILQIILIVLNNIARHLV